VTPVGGEVCIVILSVTPEYASFDKTLCEFPDLKEKLSGAELNSRERGAVTCMRTLRNVQRRNVALVGDASGGVDAITGDGIRLALRQAFALVEAMAADDLEQYEQKHRELAKGATRMGNLMLWLDRNPRLRRRVIRSFAHVGNACVTRNSGGSVFDRSATRLAAADYLRKAGVQSELHLELRYSFLAVQFR
jgi:flavin-dependent dehydrogenase